MKKYLLSAFFAVALMLPWASKAQTNCDKIQDYKVAAAAGSLATIGTSSNMSLTLNSGIAQISMPFSMVLGSQMINAGDPVYISNNGFISFTAPTAYNAMPNTMVIAPLACTGSDFYNANDLRVYEYHSADSLIVEWRDAKLDGLTFQIQVLLLRKDNEIQFFYTKTGTHLTKTNFVFARRVQVGLTENCNFTDMATTIANSTANLSIPAATLDGTTPIDNVSISLAYPTPCQVWVSNITKDSATFNWTAVIGNPATATANKYQVIYSTDSTIIANAFVPANMGILPSSFGFSGYQSAAIGADDIWNNVDNTNSSFRYGKFNPNTTYYWAVRSGYYSSGSGEGGKFSPMGKFTTAMDTIMLKRDTVCMSMSLAQSSTLTDTFTTPNTYTIDSMWNANGSYITELTSTDTTSLYTVKDNNGDFYKVRMNTIVKTLVTKDTTVNVCDTFSFNIHKFNQSAGASYPDSLVKYETSTAVFDTLLGVNECVINSLHLTIRKSTIDSVVDFACSSYTWHIEGRTSAGDFSLDSIFTLKDTTVYDTLVVKDTISMYSGSNLLNEAGCSRTTTLKLTLYNNIFDSTWIDTTIATSEGQYVYNNRRYLNTIDTADTCETYIIPYFVGTDARGCDSMRAVRLHVGSPVYTAYNVTACGEYTWTAGDGKTYAQLDENAPAGARYRNMTDGGYVYNSALPSWTFPGANNNVSNTGTYIPDTVVSLRLTLQTGYYAEQTMSLNMTTDSLVLGGTTPVTLYMADYRTGRADTAVDVSVNYGATTMYCDSIVRYHINLVYNYTEVPMTICMSEMGTPDHDITWSAGGTPRNYTIPTTLNPRNDTTYIPWVDEYVRYDETDTAQGYVLVLSVKKNTYSYDTVTACTSYDWKGTTYTVANATPAPKYTIEGGAFNGCDSVMLLHLIFDADGFVNETENVTACNSYEWQGTTYTSDVTVTGNPYVDSATHCTVTPTLVLHIATGGNSTIVDSACDSYTWHDSTYTVSTTATYTVAGAASGECDSVVTLNLTIFFSEIDTIADVVCNGYDYNRNGFSIAASAYANRNDFTAVRIERGATVHHCNIVHMLNLTVGNTQVFDTTIVACDNYIWHGTTFTNDVYLVDTVANAQGCDSITNLTVQIVASTSDTTAATACDSYTWSRNATTYTAAGTYTATETAGPCTTTHLLVLNLGTNSNVTIDTTACAAFVWDGTTYTTSQTITLPGTNAQGCDSNYIINLTVQNATNVSVVEQACGVFVWSVNGQTYTTTSTDTYEFGNCDSVYVLNVTIYPVYTQNFNVTACESYEWNDSVYTANTTATATFPTVDNCDSVVTINLSLGQSHTTDTAVAGCNSVVYDGVTYYESTERYDRYTTDYGCDSIISLVITVNHSGYSYEEDTAYNAFYTWHGMTCTSTGAYIDTLPAHGEFCDSIYILNLYVMDTTEGIELSEMGEISLYPNPTTGVLNISADNVVRVDVLDLVGRTVARFENTNRFDISRLPAGAYTLRIATTDRVMVSKVVKR